MATLFVLLLGVVVGFVAGLFGVGGGFLLTPLLALFGVPVEVAVGTGLCQIVATSLVTILRHRKQGTLDLRFDLLMLGGSIIGVDAGARLLDLLLRLGDVTIAGRSFPWVRLVVQPGYVALLVVVAVTFLRRRPDGRDAADYVRMGPLARLPLGPRVTIRKLPGVPVPALAAAYLGFVMGLLSGLLGLGGGVILVPILVYGFGFPLKAAAGTGILVLLVSSVVGTVRHALAGHVDLGLAMALLAGSPLAAQAGVRAAQRMSPKLLRTIFGVVIAGTIGAVVWDLGRRFL